MSGESRDELLRGVVDAVPDAVVVVDGDGRIVLANARCRGVFDREPAELLGQPIEVLVPEGLGASRLPGTTATGPLRLAAVRRDGTQFPAEISLAPLESGGERHVCATVRDVTERVRLLAESERLSDELIATVSHELRTPLASIIGYAELMGDLDEADLSRRARKLLSVIERNANRELELVNDLLTLAFLDGNQIPLIRRPVSLADVAGRVVGDHGLRARQRGLTLTLADGDLPPVAGDFHRLVQAVDNLVTNALKFTRPGGTVTVSLVADGAVGVVEVRDTGVGVSAEEITRIFDRLYRAPSAVEAQTQGAGLGLPIVRAIAEAHGGWVRLRSEVGVGTVVRLAVPYVDGPAAS